MKRRRFFVDTTPLRVSRDYRVIWTAQLFSLLGRQVVVVAMPYQIYILTHSSFAVGLLGLFQVGPIVLAGLYGGGLADRFDRRTVQLIGKTLAACGSLALTLGAIGMRVPVAFVFVVGALAAGAWSIDQSARAATIPRLVSPQLLPSAMGLNQITFQSAMIAGPALGGAIIASAGLQWAYAADVIVFVPAAAILFLLSPQPPANDSRVTFGWRAPAQALGYVRSHRLIFGIFAADLIATIFGMPTAVFPALALSVFGYGPVVLGLLYAGPGAGALVASVLSGWVGAVDRQGRAVLVAITVWGLAITGFGLAGRALWLGLPLLAVAGGADLISAIFRSTILQLSIPDSMRGRMSAFNSMVVTTGPRLGDLEAGAVAALVNPIFSVVSGGLATLVGIAALAAWLPELRRQRAAASAPAIAATGEAGQEVSL